jgi:hypothetical protein
MLLGRPAVAKAHRLAGHPIGVGAIGKFGQTVGHGPVSFGMARWLSPALAVVANGAHEPSDVSTDDRGQRCEDCNIHT